MTGNPEKLRARQAALGRKSRKIIVQRAENFCAKV